MPTEHVLDDELKRSFAENGYLIFEAIVDRSPLAELQRRILAEFARARDGGQLFVGGGNLSGHLNCFPGEGSRFVRDRLQASGILDIAQGLSPAPLRAPNIGCNLNLPGSASQNEHADGYAAQPFLVANVACVDTDLSNGAMEILCGTQRRAYKYWQILAEKPKRIRLSMKQGDVLLRTSALWHRGMPNLSREPRPMLAFTWEDGGSALADPYLANEGRVTFFPNRYGTDWRGQLRERAFVAAPGAANALRAIRSLFEP